MKKHSAAVLFLFVADNLAYYLSAIKMLHELT